MLGVWAGEKGRIIEKIDELKGGGEREKDTKKEIITINIKMKKIGAD